MSGERVLSIGFAVIKDWIGNEAVWGIFSYVGWEVKSLLFNVT